MPVFESLPNFLTVLEFSLKMEILKVGTSPTITIWKGPPPPISAEFGDDEFCVYELM